MKWYEGPAQDLGRNTAPVVVNEKDGSLILIGGYKFGVGFVNTTLVLPNSIDAEFEQKPISLNVNPGM